MGTFSLWQLVVMAIVTFGIVVPAVLAAWMIWRCPGRSEALARAQEEYQAQAQAYAAQLKAAVERAFGVFESKLAGHEQAGSQLTSARAMFDLWIEAAEEAYASVALSEEFREVYGAFANAQMRLRAALQREIEQVSDRLGMPTRSEMDAAHRRIAELERVVRRLLAASGAAPKAADAADGRLAIVLAEIQLYRDQHPQGPLPARLVEKAKARVAEADAASKTAYERQATISTAAYVLQNADDAPAAEALLLAELQRSHTPYYYMPELADLAEQRGDAQAAVEWLRKAYEGAEGPATRVQWGVLYVDGLVRLTPQDAGAIEAATNRVIADLDAQPESYHQRTRQRFERLGKTLTEWSRHNHGNATLARLQKRMLQSCGTRQAADAGAACERWLQG
ncbi:MAG TPA: hypothetical protein DDZ67_13040 [Xanthomonadaceae bacterium]|nr:hypothetical protein [Xanthomonadaceae bacterium]